jgi:hypothetical protein
VHKILSLIEVLSAKEAAGEMLPLSRTTIFTD